jgi:hypothetical protein
MARRTELGAIASGLVGSFNSRNNDVDGYWGIGKLYKHVAAASEKVVSIELVARSITPETNEFDSLLAFYHQKLFRYLDARHIQMAWVRSALVTVTFEAEWKPKHHSWRSAFGKPCIVVCKITDDKGRHQVAVAYNNCRPHDPQIESRSSRASNF